MHWFNNECPDGIKEYNNNKNTTYQMVPLHIHRCNAAERAIRTFKKHFKTILAGTDPKFPMHLWCRLLEQSTMTLNMLRPCWTNPKLSAYMALERAHDYNAHPIAPLGIKLTVHETVGQRASWGMNGITGWYLGPSTEHYRCYRAYIPSTKGERTAATVDFHPVNSTLPHVSAEDAATQAAKDLTAVLTKPPKNAPFQAIGDEKLNAIRELAAIFSKVTNNKQSSPDTEAAPRVKPVEEKKEASKEEVKPLPMVKPVEEIIKPPLRVNTPPQQRAPRVRNKEKPIKSPAPMPPPRPHKLSIPTPKQTKPHVIPFDDDEVQLDHGYNTRSNPHFVNCLAAINHTNYQNLFPKGKASPLHPEHLANAIIDDETGRSLKYRELITKPQYKQQ